METKSHSSAAALVLVPTELELERLAPRVDQSGSAVTVELCGFGPVAAAARAAQQIEADRPRRVILAGIAGTFSPEVLPVGAAYCFRRVALDGVGVGEAGRFVSARDLGFSQAKTQRDELSLETVGADRQQDLLLTCCAASDSAGMASERKLRHPDAVAEDMEGFGVALACNFAGVQLTILRGISNLVGDRNKSNWAIDEALAATAELLRLALAGGSDTEHEL